MGALAEIMLGGDGQMDGGGTEVDLCVNVETELMSSELERKPVRKIVILYIYMVYTYSLYIQLNIYHFNNIYIILII